MAIEVSHRRGTAADHALFTGAIAELTWNLTTKRWHGHDGTTVGGIPMARLDEIAASDLSIIEASMARGRQDLSVVMSRQSKTYAGALRHVDAIADGFSNMDGFSSVTNALNDTTAKFVRPTRPDNRIASGIAATSSFAATSGSTTNTNDNNTATQLIVTPGNLAGTATTKNRSIIKFDLGTPKSISKLEAVNVQQSAGSTGWTFYTSTDDTTLTAVGTFANVSSTPSTITRSDLAVTARYVYLVLTQTDYAAITCNIRDLNVYEPGAYNPMTLVSAAATVDAVPTALTGLLWVRAGGDSFTINTDLTLELSRDGGTNWTTATLALAATLGAAGAVYEAADVNVTSQPSGSSVVARVKTLNAKNIPLDGMVMSWR